MKTMWITGLLCALLTNAAYGTPQASVEVGALGIINHRIRLSKSGTLFDFKSQGGQENLYPFYRFQVAYSLSSGASLLFLYQPLEINTSVTLKDAVIFDEQGFPKDSNLETKYSFPFYRVSYLSNTLANWGGLKLGGALQIRNANIVFSSTDGSRRRDRADIGPVPLLVASWKSTFSPNNIFSFDIATMYAPVKYLNGSDSEVVGAFTDAAFGLHQKLSEQKSISLKIRYLGGGASGEPDDVKTPYGDNFSSNWIDAVSFSLGYQNEV